MPGALSMPLDTSTANGRAVRTASPTLPGRRPPARNTGLPSGGVAVEQEGTGRRVAFPLRRRIARLPAHGQHLHERQAEAPAEGVAFAAVELQQVGLELAHDGFDLAAGVVHEQGHGVHQRRDGLAQGFGARGVEAARAAGREDQADGVHAQLDGQADVTGAGHAAEFDPGVHACIVGRTRVRTVQETQSPSKATSSGRAQRRG